MKGPGQEAVRLGPSSTDKAHSIMRPFISTAVLVVCVALLSHSVAAFLLSSNLNPVKAVAALPAGVGSLTSPLFKGLNPLTFLLTTLGVPVDHLLDGTQKCVNQLGPEALEAVKALKRLLGILKFFG